MIRRVGLRLKSLNCVRNVTSYGNSEHSKEDLSMSLLSPTKGFGVLTEHEEDDIARLVNNYTSPALAKALREREDTLQVCAQLIQNRDYDELARVLHPFLPHSVEKRRRTLKNINLKSGFSRTSLAILQRCLHRLPRQVYHSAQRRASVVIPLCNVNGVASILFEKRSDKVCFPGGMVDEYLDHSIIQTSLREMQEEIGIEAEGVDVLGVLRCNWSEVARLTGVDVTPVVGYIGELSNIQLIPNPDEVAQVFTVPLSELLQESSWVKRDFSAPIYTGTPHTIWGLTAYLLDRFLNDVVKQFDVDIVHDKE